MGTRVRYGGYTHEVGECAVSIDREWVLSEAGAAVECAHTWTISGQVLADTTAATAAKCLGLENAYLPWGLDLVLETEDGLTCHALPNTGSLRGTRVVKPPSFPVGEGAQLSTFRDYTIVVKAEYPVPSLVLPLKSFTETVTFSGGGPRRTVVECVNVPPQEQLLSLYTAYRATQSGQAVGLLAYPPVPAAIWPFALEDAGQTGRTAPRFAGGLYTDFGVQWSYSFISAVPLFGNPNAWPASG